MKLTAFGKLVRKYRIDAGVTLKTMADDMGVSIAYLSAVETGKKKITDTIVDSAIEYFKKLGIEPDGLLEAADRSRTEFRLNVEDMSDDSRALVAAFARKFPGLSEAKREEIAKALEDD